MYPFYQDRIFLRIGVSQGIYKIVIIFLSS
jgi:hypothetical protein